jgi:hypothetical protein
MKELAIIHCPACGIPFLKFHALNDSDNEPANVSYREIQRSFVKHKLQYHKRTEE